MSLVTVYVERTQGCPHYDRGAVLEFRGQTVEGVSDQPVCWTAIERLGPLLRQAMEGKLQPNHPPVFCGGCREGKCWFRLRVDPGGLRPSRELSEAVYGALGKLKILSGVPLAQLKKIVPLLTDRQVNPGDIVIRKGEPGDALFLIMVGTFEVLSTDEHGAETLLATLGRGECFGEMSLLSGDPVSATVRSRDKGMLLFLRKSDFEKVLALIPAISVTLARLLAQRLARTSGRIVEELQSGMIGRLDHVAPAELVQAMCVNNMTGSLVVQKEGRDMVLHFRDGQIARVEYGNLSDEDAFYEFLTWAQGNFRFEQAPESSAEPPRLGMDTMGLLMEGMRRIDETVRRDKPGN